MNQDTEEYFNEKMLFDDAIDAELQQNYTQVSIDRGEEVAEGKPSKKWRGEWNAELYAQFESNNELRDKIFEIVKYEIGDIVDYINIVEAYDHSGTLIVRLNAETVHLKEVLARLTQQ